MKYIFTTLAVGDSYLQNASECYTKYSDYCCADFNITTNEQCEVGSKVNLDLFKLDRYDDGNPGFSFFLNLKVLSLKYCLDKGYDYIIYNDADWRMTENFSEDKLLNLFNHMENNDLDFLFERPSKIGDHKKDMSNCFFDRKLYDYHVFEHTKWDESHVVNEQFMVFRNNWKFRYFVRRWEEFLWYSIHNNIRNYPDGFDIGVSALEAEMKWDWNSFRGFLPSCFEFNDKLGNLHIRF
jgi:hypothetical protein